MPANTTPKATRPYTCDTCRNAISQGERYLLVWAGPGKGMLRYHLNHGAIR